MPNIGKVTVGSTTNLGTIKIKQQALTSIASPFYGPTINISLDDLTDVVIVNPQNNYILFYNQETQRFEAGPQNFQITSIFGGTF